jgi:3'-phosphoadenosine 5'-phosphosulfate sulfotransferase (PAPS reductase)/FAD synthetase
VSESKKPRIVVSFSGGKTSGYMAKYVLDKCKDTHEVLIIFANTGQEHENTLQFVHDCDTHFGFNTVWVESVAHPGERKASSHKVVSFETASRNGEPFEDMIKKYGLPNISYPHCTRELKLNPIYSYIDSLGWEKDSYKVAIGIRADESRRVSKTADTNNIFYPLIDWTSVDKQDVNSWWEDQTFTLNLQEHQGNCKWCYKKSDKKLYRLAQESPEIFDFPRRMEESYGHLGPRKDGLAPIRVFFRRNRSTEQVLKEAALLYDERRPYSHDPDADGGCSESCELYPTENI